MIKSKYYEYKSLKAKEKQLKEDIDKLQIRFSEKMTNHSGNPFLNFYGALGDDQNRILKNYQLREISSEIAVIRFQFMFLIIVIFTVVVVLLQFMFLL